MKKVYVLLTVLSANCVLAQSVDWIDTLTYGTEIVVTDILVNSAGEAIVSGAYGAGYSAPDLSQERCFLEAFSPSGGSKWLNTKITVGWASNIVTDVQDNIYLALGLMATPNVTPQLNGNNHDPGTYLLKFSTFGNIQWISQKQDIYTVPGLTTIRPNGEIQVTSLRPGGSARHVYDTAGNLLSVELDPNFGDAQYDKFGNGYQRHDENGQVWLIKYDATEKELWRVLINNQTGFVLERNGNCYLLEQGPYMSSSVSKLSHHGQLLWLNKYSTECGFRAATDDANLYLIGVFGSQDQVTGGVVKKIDLNTGAEIWSTKINNSLFRPVDIVCAESFIYACANNIEENREAYVVKLIDAQWQKPDPIVTSISNKKATPSFAVYPNPTSDIFTLTPPENCGVFSYRVLDATGRLVFHKQNCELPADATERIDLSGFSKGLYTLTIELSDGSRQSKKLLVK